MAVLLRNNNQVVGNVGLFFVCYQLSRRGWNAMPTARNAKGIDILIYSQDAQRKLTVQVKALSKSNPVPLGTKLDGLFGDFFVICRNVARASPECFVLKPEEVSKLAHRGEKEGKVSYWLQPKDYAVAEFREKWERIGKGAHEALPRQAPNPYIKRMTTSRLSACVYRSCRMLGDTKRRYDSGRGDVQFFRIKLQPVQDDFHLIRPILRAPRLASCLLQDPHSS